jgi:hypothetical protein
MRGGLGIVVVLAVGVSCGGEAAPPTEAQPTTAPAGAGLVVETRPITDAELASLSDDDGHAPLACEGYGSAQWDWGPISSDADAGGEAGREPEDALADAIADLNDDEVSAVAPTEGWVELVEDDGDRVFVVEDDTGAFVAAVHVSGDEARGVWRHHKAVLCPDANA